MLRVGASDADAEGSESESRCCFAKVFPDFLPASESEYAPFNGSRPGGLPGESPVSSCSRNQELEQKRRSVR